MACCPFHDDKTPSLKVYDDHFYCFGCGATGNCTGFVAKLFGLRQIDAAKKISEDFGLGLFDRGIAVPIKMAANPKYEMQKWLSEARQTVKEYLTTLYKWHRDYAPRNQYDEFHPLFVESLQKIDYVEYLQDILTHGSEDDRQNNIKQYGLHSIEVQSVSLCQFNIFAVLRRRVQHIAENVRGFSVRFLDNVKILVCSLDITMTEPPLYLLYAHTAV